MAFVCFPWESWTRTPPWKSSPDPWDEFEFSDVRMVDLGDDEAALCYRAEASRDNDKYVALISTVYTRLSGKWKLTLHQQTPIET